MKIAVLGSTGSIGTQALEVIRALGYEVSALVAGSNIDLLAEQIEMFAPQLVSVRDEAAKSRLHAALSGRRADHKTELLCGPAGAVQAAVAAGTDRVLAAVSGFAGMPPVVAALRAGIDVALANKETLVSAGSLVKAAAAAGGARIIPVDSEHAAVFQCLQGKPVSAEETIFLTCSGGPFFGRSRSDLARVTVQDALAHPTWQMGRKISIDSATLMNKALEVIEASVLFGAQADQIRVIVHRESIVHSMVAFADGSVLAQLGFPDMRLAIQQALTYPAVVKNTLLQPFDPTDEKAATLTFQPVDDESFPAIMLAREALRRGGTAPLVLNAANEAAVSLFLQEKIPFLQITELVSDALERYRHWSIGSLETAGGMMDLHRTVMSDVRRR